MDLDPLNGRAVEAALELGLLARLQQQAGSLAELTQELELSERGVRPLLNLLVSTRLISLDAEGRYHLPDSSAVYLEEEFPEQWAALSETGHWEGLEQAVRTGRPVRPPVEGEEDQGEFFSTIAPALFELHFSAAVEVAGRLPEELAEVLDLGAGTAVWSLGLAIQRETLRVTAVDRPKVLDYVTATFLAELEMEHVYTLRPGDYHTVDLEDAFYDLVYLGHLLHAEGWEGSRALLARAQRCLKPGGSLVLAEIVPGPAPGSYAAHVFDINMLLLTRAGLVFTEPQLEQLTHEAGFQQLQWLDVEGEYPVLLARKPL